MDIISRLNVSDSIIELSGDSPTRLISPRYPCAYPININIKWIFTAEQANKVIVVHVVHFSLINQDKVTIGNGDDASISSTVIANITSKMTRIRRITTMLSTMWITFESHRGVFYWEYGTGFVFDVQQTENDTGGFS